MHVQSPHYRTKPISDYICLETFTSDEHLIASQGHADPLMLGKSYEMSPLPGGGHEFDKLVLNLFKDLPDHSVLTTNLFVTPDHAAIERFRRGKIHGGEMIQELINRQCQIFEKALRNPLSDNLPILNHRRVVMSLACPIRKLTDATRIQQEELHASFLKALKSCGFYDAKALRMHEVFAVYEQMANPYAQRPVRSVDELLELSVQAFGPDRLLNFADHPRVAQFGDDLYVAGVACKAFPGRPMHALMNLVSGAPFNHGAALEGGGERISSPFIISTVVRIADQAQEQIETTRAVNSRSPEKRGEIPIELGNEKTDEVLSDLMYMQRVCTSDSNKYVYASTTSFVFGKTSKEALTNAGALRTHMDHLQFDARVIEGNLDVRWAQALPMNFSKNLAERISGEGRMPAAAAGRLLPVFSDYTGNVTPNDATTGLPLITRRGLMLLWNLWRSNGNYCGTICAAGGSGKSFFVQFMILCLLADGASVFMVDVGQSLKKFARSIGAEYNDFILDDPDAPNLNPMQGLTDKEFNEQLDLISSLMLGMCYYDQAPEDGARIAMQEAVRAARGRDKMYATPRSVLQILEELTASLRNNRADQSLNAAEKAAINLVPRLKSFLDAPSRARYFNGEGRSLNYENRAVFYELGGLAGDKHLQQVVTFFVMNDIMNRRKKIEGRMFVGLDEAFDLLKNPQAADMIGHLYQKGRKDDIAVWIIVQTLQTLLELTVKLPGGQEYNIGKFILGQSAWKVVLAQDKSEIRKVFADGGLESFREDPWFQKMLESVETQKGVFSEALIFGNGWYEAGRLYVDPFVSTLFSSEGEDRRGVFELMDNGMSAVDAIYEVMGDRSHRARDFAQTFLELLKGQCQMNRDEAIRILMEIKQ